MDRPRISKAISWLRYEKAVLDVFTESLRRLATLFDRLPAAEEPINLQLYWIALQVHHEILTTPMSSFPFTIDPDSTNAPEWDDNARSKRLKKRPDFKCLLKNPNVNDYRKSQIVYILECKRLGENKGDLLFNEFYSENGIQRFVHADWGYAKGCDSATMIGYLQNMAPDEVLKEVNNHAITRNLPSLHRATEKWYSLEATMLIQAALSRSFEPTQIKINHLWIDLRHCRFDLPSDHNPRSIDLQKD